MEKVSVGIVGAGLVSNSHARGYLKHDSAEIVAVCDLDEGIATARAKAWAAKRIYRDFDEMLKDPGLDAVDIMTPPHLHHDMTIRAANAGKHVNCEKPFCRSVKEGKEMVDAAECNGVLLAVDESYVFTSSHLKAREMIEAGDIGEPMQVRQRHGNWNPRGDDTVAGRRLSEIREEEKEWRIDPALSGGGSFPWIFDHGVHLFATARYFMEEADIESVYALAGTYSNRDENDTYARGAYKDIPIITWKFSGGNKQGVWMRGERLVNSYDYRSGFSSVILGTDGMIEVLGEGGGNLFHNGKPVHLILYRAGGEIEAVRFEEGGDQVWDSEISYYDQAHVNQVSQFIDCITRGEKVRYGGEDGTMEVKETLAVIKSAMEERPVKVNEVEDEFTAY